ncbi:MAG: ATP-dependent Clp protease proteolytic subunit [Candidatus Saccharibacteria bacterium]|nr:ATP-dependent Clp protease proteolytic subunit [Candidatus Saccharibacteria bacterium]
MLKDFIPDQFKVSLNLGECLSYREHLNRQLYLDTAINYADGVILVGESSIADELVGWIFEYNREDRGKPIEERKPVRLYIDSPGGDVTSGFAIINAIKISKTPIYTINVGQWSSMAFLIGITGHRRFSLSDMTFLMHDGSMFAAGSTNKAQDKMKFDQRYENEVIKNHVLKYSKMTSSEYDALSRVEYYMLPKDALEHGFIDEVVEDIDTIL